MRRFPTVRLTLAAVVMTAGIAGAARAEDAPAAKDAPESSEATDTDENEVVAIAAKPSSAQGEQPAPTPAAAPQAPPGPTTASPNSPVLTPVLAPAATVDADAAKKKEDKFPLSGSVSMSNSAGNGWLAPASTYQMQPNWSTAVSLSGRAALPQLDPLPKMSLSTGMSFNVANWLDAYSNGGVYSRQVRASDINLGLGMGKIYTEPYTNIGVGANVSGRIPVSITSRHRNVLTTLGLGAPVSWSMKDEQPWGSISVNYSPGVRFSLYTAPATTIPCEAGVSRASIVENPLEDGLLPVAYGREAQLLPDGSCVLPGRQNIFAFSQSLGVGWGLGDHSVSADIGYSAGFLQPLPTNPSLQSEFSSNQNFSETTNGSISYSYKVPVDFNLSISTGLSSSQSPWRITGLDEAGNTVYEPTFPFWDFFTPANNSSSAFIDVSIGI